MSDPDKKPDPKKYDYPGAPDDDKIVHQVETQIKIAFPLSYTAGLVESVAQAPIDKHEVESQRKEYDDKVAEAKKDHPDDVKKEEQESGPPPRPGAPVQPNVQQHSAKAANDTQPDSKKGQEHKPGSAPAPKAKGGSEHLPTPPSVLVLTAAASGDMNLDKWLDGYPNKAPETKEKVSKIKEMGTIAKGFDGQVEGYVKKGDGFSESAKSAMTWLGGKKEINAAFGENPYEKVHGGLGLLMQGISRFQNVVSIVGNVAGKVGLILTLVGLLAMIFPPLGALIEAVARIINIIGIVCDVLGLALAGVLVGLNGVVLAQQIAKGGSNEEKAATADNMMSEANSAGGHILSLAMTYGPGFMKGFKGASKGAVGALFSKFKAKIGTFISKEAGAVTNFAKNAAYKLGLGLGGEAGLIGRVAGKVAGGVATGAEAVWHSPVSALRALRNTKAISWINNRSFMKGAANLGAKLDNLGWAKSVEDFGEKMGGAAAGRVAKVGEGEGAYEWTKNIQKNSAQYTQDAKDAIEARLKNAETAGAANEANRMNAKISRDIDTAQNNAGRTYGEAQAHGFDEGLAAKSEQYAAQAENLEKGRGAAVSDAKGQGSAAAKKQYEAAEAKEAEKKAAETAEDDAQKEFKKDPKKFQDETAAQEAVARKERDDITAKLKDKSLNLSNDERAALKAERAKILHEIDERRLVPLKASGGESAEHLWDAKKLYQETSASAQLQDEKGEKAESINKYVENKEGKTALEGAERAEQRHHIHEWTEHDASTTSAADEANVMLEGLDEELAHEEEEAHDDHEGDEDAGADGGDTTSADGGDDGAGSGSESVRGGQPQSAMPDAAGGEPGGSEVPAPAAAPPAAAPAAPAPSTELPQLVYWPALAGPDGDFAKAATELTRMKQYAYAYQKAQVEAKKKAVEAYHTFLSTSEISQFQTEQAKAHQAATHGTVNEAGNAMGAAAKGTAKTDEGAAEQDKGKANANGKSEEVPDVGEKPGWRHPIKRIWWKLKKWAAEKMASVMGWIQEKIASLVLMGICGVTMGQLKQYTGALHRRMDYSKGVGVSALSTSADAESKGKKNETLSQQYGHDAMRDAADCDKNIDDAAQFMKNVEDTEKEVAAEQARATAFMANLRASVATEKEQLAQEKAKKAADALKQGAAAGAGAGVAAGAGAGAGAGPSVAVAPRPAPSRRKSPGARKGISSGAAAKVQSAGNYVVNQAGVVIEQITSAKQQQRDKLKEALKEKPKKVQSEINAMNTGATLVVDTTSHLELVKSSMRTLVAQTPQSAAEARSNASKIRDAAQSVDTISMSANQSLNTIFKTVYDSAMSHA